MRDPKTQRFRAAHDPGDLLGAARAVLRHAAASQIGCSVGELMDAEILDVSQAAFDRNRCDADHATVPSAREICRQTGLSWSKLKEHIAENRDPALALAQAKVRKRDWRHDPEEILFGLVAVARRLGIQPAAAEAEEAATPEATAEPEEEVEQAEEPAPADEEVELEEQAAAELAEEEDAEEAEEEPADDDEEEAHVVVDDDGDDAADNRRVVVGGERSTRDGDAGDDVAAVKWMSKSVYRVMRQTMLSEDRRRHRHGGALFLPTMNQVTEAAGSWDRALELASLPKLEWRSGNHGLSVAEALDLCFEQHRVLPTQNELMKAWRVAQGLPVSKQVRSWPEELASFRERWLAVGIAVPVAPPPKDQRPDYTLKCPDLPELPSTHVRKRRLSHGQLVDSVVSYLKDLPPSEVASAAGYRHWSDQRPDEPSIATLTRRSRWNTLLHEARERLRANDQ